MAGLVAPTTPPKSFARSSTNAKFSLLPIPRPPDTITSASSRLIISAISFTLSVTFALITSSATFTSLATTSPSVGSSTFWNAPERNVAICGVVLIFTSSNTVPP